MFPQKSIKNNNKNRSKKTKQKHVPGVSIFFTHLTGRHTYTHTHNSVESFRKNLDVFQLGESGLSFAFQNITLQYLLVLDVN